MMQLTIDTPEDMELFGARLAGALTAGSVVALNGELGAGKTTLTRGIGEALAIRGAITSPTFVLARTHPRAEGEPPLVHVDAYRLSSAVELDDLDIDFDGSIVVVEWARDWLDSVAESWLEIDISRPSGAERTHGVSGGVENTDFDSESAEPRRVTITGHGPHWQQPALDVLTN